MEIKKLKKKTKIIIEYSIGTGYLGFGSLSKKDLEKLVINVFLHDGTRIVHEDIQGITFKVSEEKKQ